MNTKKNILYYITVLVTVSALSTSATGSAVAVEASTTTLQINQIVNIDNSSELNETELEMAFEAIESIPDSVLKNEQLFEQWKSTHLKMVSQPRASIGECAWGITKTIAANIFVFSKVAKLKTIIKAAGGAKAIAQTAIKAYKVARNEKKLSRSQAIAAASEAVAVNGGEQALSLLLEFFSVDGVVTGCFS